MLCYARSIASAVPRPHRGVVYQQHAGHSPSIHMRLAHAQTSPQRRRRGCKSPGVVAQRVSYTSKVCVQKIKDLRVAQVCRAAAGLPQPSPLDDRWTTTEIW
jgi:hypothetical protein